MTKSQSQVLDLENALRKLEEGVAGVKDDLDRDGVIQRFEFTFELAWKLMQTINATIGTSAHGPKNVIRESAKNGLIDNPEEWILLLKQRNLIAHIYKEELAKEVFETAKKFPDVVSKLVEQVKKYLAEDSE